eukprot:2247729-Amphidinium_carterae.1
MQVSAIILTFTYVNSGINYYDEGNVTPIGSASLWNIHPDACARIVTIDMLVRAVNALELNIEHFVLEGPPRLADLFTLPPLPAHIFVTSWMGRVQGSYAIIVDATESDLFVLYRTRSDVRALRGGHARQPHSSHNWCEKFCQLRTKSRVGQQGELLRLPTTQLLTAPAAPVMTMTLQ